MYDIEKYITNAIEIMVKKYISKLQFNSYIIANVTVVTTGTPNTYTVAYASQTLSGIKAVAGVTPIVGSIVYLCVPNQVYSGIFISCIIP